MDEYKLDFLSSKLIPLLKNLQATEMGKWGKMNAQQMIEHLAGFFSVSTNKINFPLVTLPEHLPKYKAFLLSDKEFRENTKAPVLPEDPLPLKFTNINEAIHHLEDELHLFITQFKKEPSLTSQHPVFGELNFDEWVLLHYKHSVHHLKQFGLQQNQ